MEPGPGNKYEVDQRINMIDATQENTIKIKQRGSSAVSEDHDSTISSQNISLVYKQTKIFCLLALFSCFASFRTPHLHQKLPRLCGVSSSCLFPSLPGLLE